VRGGQLNAKQGAIESGFDGWNWDSDWVEHERFALPDLVPFLSGPYRVLEGAALSSGGRLSEKLKGNSGMAAIKFEKMAGKIGLFNLLTW
jgi:hypothetical protein